MRKFVTSQPPKVPGEWLRDDMRRGGLTQSDLAKECGVSRFRINEILNGKRTLTADSAVRIGAALNVSAESLMSMQVRYDLYQARKKIADDYIQQKTMTLRSGTVVHIHGDMCNAIYGTNT